MPDFRKKIGIGTVQFGADYGISNKTGKTPPDEVRKILNVATENELKIIDTARLYGDSETVLGETLAADHKFSIVSKTIPVKKNRIENDDRIAVRNGIQKSLQELHSQSIYGLILHHADDLCADGGQGIYEDLLALKESGQIHKLGISAYDSGQIDAVLSKYPIDLIQVPINIFDQRLVKDGTLKSLSRAGVEVHARSAFLQGVAFMEPHALPSYLQDLKNPLKEFAVLCQDNNLDRAAGAMSYLMGLPEIGTVICGVNTAVQLQELCKYAANLPVLPKDFFDNIAVDRADLVNPALWPRPEQARSYKGN